ncbi:MAG: glycosyl hydrolase family 98 [Planctomycetaceae bacterium]|nr:glycosyl hydrolase family 98 [Planctomycetaceae bacterium]
MKSSFLIALLLVVCATVDAADKPQALVKAARAILDDWHNQKPEKDQRYLHIVCWTPSDRELPKDYRPRLTRMMQHIQDFYAKEMSRHGFGERSFNLRIADDKLLDLRTVTGKFEASHYAVQSGGEIRRECLPVLKKAGIQAEDETILIFCNLATWDAERKVFRHKSPYYAGGSYLGGTAWQLDSPELDSLNLKLKKPIISDGQYGRISLGKHNSIFIGGIAHELGHALGLPHCKERPDEAVRGTALMGSGNRTYGDEVRGDGPGSFITLAHAMRLASHPQFSGSLKGFETTAKASIDGLKVTADKKAINVSGVVQGKPPVYGVVAYFDPEGGGDYNSTTAVAVPDADGQFSLSTTALPPGKLGQLRLFPLHTNGSAAAQMSQTRFSYPYRIADDGTPDLSVMQLRLDLKSIIAAIQSKDKAAANKLASHLKSEQATKIAARLTRQSPTQTPADYDGDETEIPLTNFKASEIKVGWARPTFDRVPSPTVLLESAGRIFQTGIYAHAPARHVYQVGGMWKMLTGKAGIDASHNGSVQFEIKADGKSVWKSRTTRSGKLREFRIDLDGVKEIELLTHPTKDGPGSDWSLWLEPTLSRTAK